jgi:hypothetical protein
VYLKVSPMKGVQRLVLNESLHLNMLANTKLLKRVEE